MTKNNKKIYQMSIDGILRTEILVNQTLAAEYIVCLAGTHELSGYFYESIGGELWVVPTGGAGCGRRGSITRTRTAGMWEHKDVIDIKNPKIDFVGLPPTGTQTFAAGDLATVPVQNTVDTLIVTSFNKKCASVFGVGTITLCFSWSWLLLSWRLKPNEQNMTQMPDTLRCTLPAVLQPPSGFQFYVRSLAS